MKSTTATPVADVTLSASQRNIFTGVAQDNQPDLYLVSKEYRFLPRPEPELRAALYSVLISQPVQLCVLTHKSDHHDFPVLARVLRPEEIIFTTSVCEGSLSAESDLTSSWATGITDTPLVRYTLLANSENLIEGLCLHAHHIVLDGGAFSVIEEELAQSFVDPVVSTSPERGITALARAHRREQENILLATQKYQSVVQAECSHISSFSRGVSLTESSFSVAHRAVLQQSVRISGDRYDSILALEAREMIPLHVLLATALAALSSQLYENTLCSLIFPLDNRFGDSELSVATCLVNSATQHVTFSPLTATVDVARQIDRDYVRSVRRRWFREENYRRILLATQPEFPQPTWIINMISQPCSPLLRPFLLQDPLFTCIGPAEHPTIHCIHNAENRTLDLSVWYPSGETELVPNDLVDRLSCAWFSLARFWNNPLAMTVDAWSVIDTDGSSSRDHSLLPSCSAGSPAWFLDSHDTSETLIEQRPYVSLWVAWLIHQGLQSGTLLVVIDDHSDSTIDLLLASHLLGAGYSACHSVEESAERVAILSEHSSDGVFVVDVRLVDLSTLACGVPSEVITSRLAQVREDDTLAQRIAYVMPTSGSTGKPKLVPITHGSLAIFCSALQRFYGWGPHDRILQSAPLTSDISVEEIFGSASSGSSLIRSTSLRSGDLESLTQEVREHSITILDLPTSLWHLLSNDFSSLAAIYQSSVRQIILGGEPLRPQSLSGHLALYAPDPPTVISTYGPTETTVVATLLPLPDARESQTSKNDDPEFIPSSIQRVGIPVVPYSVFLSFGELIIVDGTVSPGYLGNPSSDFGVVTLADGVTRRAYATADRVEIDGQGFPIFRGRKDSLVKISGQRVDCSDLMRLIAQLPHVLDYEIQPRDGRLVAWFHSVSSEKDGHDPALENSIRELLWSAGVPSFVVTAVKRIPRSTNGKVDHSLLPSPPHSYLRASKKGAESALAEALAHAWSHVLGHTMLSDSSLSRLAIGSLDLIRLLPETRKILGRPVTVVDLLRADSAVQLCQSLIHSPLELSPRDPDIDRDVCTFESQGGFSYAPSARIRESNSLLLLGASGVFGTGFGSAVLDLLRRNSPCPPVVFHSRSPLPPVEPWISLASYPDVSFRHSSGEFSTDDLQPLLETTGAGVVVNSLGNTNMLAPYLDIRQANVEIASSVAQVCCDRGIHLVHLSTFGVSASPTASRVIDPRAALYHYSAAKGIAEIAIAGVGAPPNLDFTVVRLPRLLGTPDQITTTTDILVSLVDACIALDSFPFVDLTEEVTTSYHAAVSILSSLREAAAFSTPGTWNSCRNLTVVRGESTTYRDIFRQITPTSMDLASWKSLLDTHPWARANPQRWAIIDLWVSVMNRCGGLSYSDFYSTLPTKDLLLDTVTELSTPSSNIWGLLTADLSESVKAKF